MAIGMQNLIAELTCIDPVNEPAPAPEPGFFGLGLGLVYGLGAHANRKAL